ncbi:MAG: DUF1592 domain-containing protein [Myxococcales bacterium]
MATNLELTRRFGGTVPRLASTMLAASLLALGCTGQVSPSQNPAGSSGGKGSTGGSQAAGTGGSGSGSAPGSGGMTVSGSGGTVGGGVVGPPPLPPAPLDESAGPLPLTRLTHREFSNTMADLLGDTTVAGAAFEADNAGPAGYLAPANVATENARQYSTAAEKLAAAAVAGGKVGLPCTTPANAAAETTCVTQFITQFGARAYRRPLVKGESDDLLALFQSAKTLGFTFQESVTRVVEAILQSPNLLYHWELADQRPSRDPSNNALVSLTPHQVASRLSYFLWEAPPDAMLLDAATRGDLATPEGVKAQALRLLQDEPHAKKALFNFHSQWLHVDTLADLVPDLAGPLTQEVEAFVSSVFLTGDGTLKTLLTAPYTFANATTAKEYGLTVAGTAMTKVDLNPAQRRGILMQVPFLRANSIAPPVHRGLVVYRQLLCGVIPPPPAAVPDVAPDSPNSTTRERFDVHSNLACAQACHTRFDPWGFAFENFDALGHYRTTENGKPVDPSGVLQANGTVGGTTPQMQTLAFKNAGELVDALAGSSEVSWCTANQWARYMLHRFETDADKGALTNAYVSASYAADRVTARPFSVRDFLVALVTTKAFRFRQPSPGEAL